MSRFSCRRCLRNSSSLPFSVGRHAPGGVSRLLCPCPPVLTLPLTTLLRSNEVKRGTQARRPRGAPAVPRAQARSTPRREAPARGRGPGRSRRRGGLRLRRARRRPPPPLRGAGRQTRLPSPFTGDTEAQREEPAARGHRAGPRRTSAREPALPRRHGPRHCVPGTEATPAAGARPRPACPALYKALVPRNLYINHPFLPALLRPVCWWVDLGWSLGLSDDAIVHPGPVF